MMQYPLFEEEDIDVLTPSKRFCKADSDENKRNDSPEGSPGAA